MVPFLADFTLSLYFGVSRTRASDLAVSQEARGNRATIHSVAWRDYPGRAPIYYGIRLTYSPPNHPWTRIALDYTHLKIYADTSEVTPQSGLWHGTAFSETSAIRERVQSFEITHGLNLIGVAVLQQLAGPPGTGTYVGAGPVIYLPHAESRVDGIAGANGYEYGGGGFQVAAGLAGCAGVKPFYLEAKYSHGSPAVTIAQGRARTRVDTMHELIGLGLRRCPR